MSQAQDSGHASAVDPIAIIGLSCTFPQDASSPEAFWKMIVEGRSARTKIPQTRFDSDAFYDPSPGKAGTINVRHAHFLKEDVGAFDAPFFSIPFQEAAAMDPQQRGLLETSYHALENAGITLDSIRGSNTAVYIGSASRDYELIGSKDIEQMPTYFALGAIPSIQSNRLSWFYDLRGPSMTIDTACSGSMQAIYLAAQSLLTRECEMCITGGSNLILTPELTASLSNFGFLSPDGKCHSFDHRANGYARGEGHGIIILKRFADAIRDGNTIRAVIRAVSSNQDGRTSVLSRPSRDAQAELIRRTYAKASLGFDETRFFEAHGTGTPVGDPIEASAVADVFKTYRTPDQPLYVASVKSAIGHLEGASGVAGVIKAILAVERGIIPPTVWFEKVNPDIDAKEWNLEFPTKALRWPPHDVRRASVNSFGAGGANAHVVIDDAYNFMRIHGIDGQYRRMLPNCSLENSSASLDDEANNASYGTDPPTDLHISLRDSRNVHRPIDTCTARRDMHSKAPSRPRHNVGTVVLSSADEDGIERLVTKLGQHLSSALLDTETALTLFQDLTYTLSTHRNIFPWKSYVVASSLDDLCQKLSMKEYAKPVRSTQESSLFFVFTGQGAQWPGMGMELLVYPQFRESIQESDRFLSSLGCNWLASEELQRFSTDSDIHKTEFSQTLCTVLQVALVDLLQSWKIQPRAVVGHSSGEIAAAYCAGSLSRESAWRIAYYRGHFSALLDDDQDEKGAMLAVPLDESDISPFVSDITAKNVESRSPLTIACSNGPKNITISGSERLIDQLATALERSSIHTRKLKVTVAYHSKRMEAVAAAYCDVIQDISRPTLLHVSALPRFFSSLYGKQMDTEVACQASYWVDNLTSKVRFADAIRDLGAFHDISKEEALFVEIGPHPALRKPVLDTLASCNWHGAYDSVVRRDMDTIPLVSKLLGTLFQIGCLPAAGVLQSTIFERKPRLLVELPEYPFNHSRAHFAESRMSKEFRTKRVPRNIFLGSRAIDWNPAEPRWRNFITLSDHEWIQDHQFNDAVLYPGAGIAIMAVEAARHLAQPGKGLLGVRLRNVNFSSPIVFADDTAQREIHVHLKSDDHNEQSTEYMFNVYQVSAESKWDVVSSGRVALEYTGPENHVNEGPVISMSNTQSSRSEDWHDVEIQPLEFYEMLASYGLVLNSAFQLTKEASYSKQNTSTTVIKIAATTSERMDSCRNVPLIHPTTLDAVMQAALVLLVGRDELPSPNILPTLFRHVWLSEDLNSIDSTELDVYCKTTFVGFREAEFSIEARDRRTQRTFVVLDGYRTTNVVTTKAEAKASMLQKCICYKTEWKPDLSVMNNSEIERYLLGRRPKDVDDRRIEDVELCCLYFMMSTTSNTMISSKPQLRKYASWMRRQLSSKHAETVLAESKAQNMFQNVHFREKFLSRLENSGPGGKMAVVIGRNLSKILDEVIDPLELLFNEAIPLAQDFYQGPDCTMSYHLFTSYLDSISHQNPNMSIVEIGAGTGGATRHALVALGGKPNSKGSFTPRFDKYDFTDISPSFFSGARSEFGMFGQRLGFKTLDISQSPVEQGFEKGHYDLVIASNVLHATEDINKTLKHARELLKPGGKLVAIELSDPEATRVAFAFALLPGWWLSKEETRKWSPALSKEGWHDALSKSGFSGTDTYLRDYDVDHSLCVIVSEAVGVSAMDATQIATAMQIVILADEDSKIQQLVASELVQHMSEKGHVTQLLTFGEATNQEFEKSSTYICLSELDRPVLCEMEQRDFDCLKHIAQHGQSVLWVVSESQIGSNAGLSRGLGRCIYSERPNFVFTSLIVETSSDATEISGAITRILDNISNLEVEEVETEYLLCDGILHTNRIVEGGDLNRKLHLKTAEQTPEIQMIKPEVDRPLKLTIGRPGLIDTLYFVDVPFAGEHLQNDEIEIEVRAAALSARDAAVIMGHVPGNYIGLQCSGIVSRVGTSCTRFKVGDNVACIKRGVFGTHVRCIQQAAISLPRAISFIEGSLLCVDLLVSYTALMSFANIRKGQFVLIYDGLSNLGRAAIRICQTVGAEVLTTVASIESRNMLRDEFGLPSTNALDQSGIGFSDRVLAKTNGMGINVAIGSFFSIELTEVFRCVRSMGRLIEIRPGTNEAERKNLPAMPNIAFITTTFEELIDHGLETGDLQSAFDLLAGQKFLSKELDIFKASDLQAAVRSQQGHHASGFSAVDFGGQDALRIAQKPPGPVKFDENASYVVSGGLGGLGRSIGRWMARHGAKNLIFLSRSGGSGAESFELTQELRRNGLNVFTPECDIANEQSLVEVLQHCKATMPPIRGCFQGAMVLKDSLFQNMSLEDFNAALRPKVEGSRNLHNHLPPDLSFFVLLSSSMGIIGNPGQSNYAAANTYQDALARHRVANGQHAVSLALGVVTDVGYVSERIDIRDRMLGSGYTGISERELHSILDSICGDAIRDPECIKSPKFVSNIMTGLTPHVVFEEQGISTWPMMSRPLFSHLKGMDRVKSSILSQSAGTVQRTADEFLQGAETAEDAYSIIAQLLVARVAKALFVPEVDIDLARAASAQGVDSLVGVELRAWVKKELSVELSIFEILQSHSLAAVARLINKKRATGG